MPALLPSSFSARIKWLGVNPDRAAGLPSHPVDRMPLTFAGHDGETHSGLTRPSCSRVTSQHPKGTRIRNVRQLTILSAEDLAAIAAEMGVTAMDPGLTGASLVIEGIPDFTHVPPSSRLQGPDGVTLVVDMENRPCHLPAKPIDAQGPGNGRAFKTAARGRRGVTAWVEREGVLSLGDVLRLHIPDQPVWPHLASARAQA